MKNKFTNIFYFCVFLTVKANDNNNTETINITNTNSMQHENNLLKIIIETVFFIFFVILIIASVYYRYHVNKFGLQPFRVPSFTPDIMFPRKEYDPLLRKTVDRNLERIFGDSF